MLRAGWKVVDRGLIALTSNLERKKRKTQVKLLFFQNFVV
jgi:hypothetical protein